MGVGWRASTIHLTAMANLEDLDDASFIVHRVDDSVGALADAIALLVSGKLLAAAWARSLREALDAGNDADSRGPRLNGLEFLHRGCLDENVIACHAGEAP